MKLRFAFVAMLLAFTAGTIFAQNESGKWQWKSEKPLVGFSKTYHLFRGEETVPCFVNVGDLNVTIVARSTDADGNWYLQVTDITAADPEIKVRHYSTQWHSAASEMFTRQSPDKADPQEKPKRTPDASRGSYKEDKTGPDVFRDNYLEAAKMLPAEVQAKFIGKYL